MKLASETSVVVKMPHHGRPCSSTRRKKTGALGRSAWHATRGQKGVKLS